MNKLFLLIWEYRYGFIAAMLLGAFYHVMFLGLLFLYLVVEDEIVQTILTLLMINETTVLNYDNNQETMLICQENILIFDKVSRRVRVYKGSKYISEVKYHNTIFLDHVTWFLKHTDELKSKPL